MHSYNWQCPFCGCHTTITGQCRSTGRHQVLIENKLGSQVIITTAIVCPNPACGELYVEAGMASLTKLGTGYIDHILHTRWVLRPQGDVKPFPAYVPKPLLDDYLEACLIKDLSPKASATLSRRCLQGMIRDFWGIRKDRLFDEIKALEDRVDPKIWQAIDAVRKIGNVGAHMEKEINQIVEVEPRESFLLIQLIETLIEEWYINRHERNRRMDEIIESAASKKPKAQPTLEVLDTASVEEMGYEGTEEITEPEVVG